MAPQELTLPGVGQRNRKAALTMSALFVLAICLIFLFARWYLQNSREHMLREMGQEMNSQASGKVALLTVWSGTLAGQVNVFHGGGNRHFIRGNDFELHAHGSERREKGYLASLRTSSMPPRMKKASSGTMSSLPSRISLNPRTVSATGT